jgi:two-component system sensor kinase FixL
MGLGLFVVRSLTEAQGGTAWYEPVPEGGSAFCFTLPIAEPESGRLRSAAHELSDTG